MTKRLLIAITSAAFLLAGVAATAQGQALLPPPPGYGGGYGVCDNHPPEGAQSDGYFNDHRPLTLRGQGFTGRESEPFIMPGNICTVDFGNYINTATYEGCSGCLLGPHSVRPVVNEPLSSIPGGDGEAQYRLQCQLDGETPRACIGREFNTSFQIDVSHLAEGDHTVRMTSPDYYPETGVFEFTIDLHAPAAPTIARFPNDTTYEGEAIDVTAERDSYLFCRWDYQSDHHDGHGSLWNSTRYGSDHSRWQACDSPIAAIGASDYYGNLAKLEMRAVDPAGNVSPVSSYIFTTKPIRIPVSPRIRAVLVGENDVTIHYDVDGEAAGGRIVRYECSLTTWEWGSPADQNASAGEFRPCARPAVYKNLPGAATGELPVNYYFMVRAVSDHGLYSFQPAGTGFTIGLDPRVVGIPGTWEAAPGGCWVQTSFNASEPESDYGRDPICPTVLPPRVQKNNVTITAKLGVPRAGRIQHTLTIGTAKTSACSLGRAYKRKTTAELTCTLGRKARAALRTRPMTVKAVTRFVPRSGPPTTVSKSIKIPRKR